MPVGDLRFAILDQLGDLYANERLALIEVERLEGNSRGADLRRSLSEILTTTKELKRRVEVLLTRLSPNPLELTTGPFERIVENEFAVHNCRGSDEFHDKSLIASVRHGLEFEIAAYATALRLVKQLDYSNAINHLKDTGLLWEDTHSLDPKRVAECEEFGFFPS